jgi:hypothetical protein
MKAWDDPDLTPYEILMSFDNPMMSYPQAGSFASYPDVMDIEPVTSEDDTAS